ncbi:WhiB family transcriptional regulator [Streptomyces sp. NBRC 109706]|uniref:WhiB family transcriptional regulator n=1 Tax=Streptomyces sp. NBRC 109706 TaxID=1550035 RepID=UPI0007866B3F|nr:WhiB family transcriptional regulator [Streptomyces sp. NBRC 109706]
MTSHDWELSAACRRPGADPDAWYPTTGQTADVAKKICWARPSRVACLEAAMAEEHPANPQRVRRWGIRGGLDPAERAEKQRRRTIAADRAATPTPTN